jgi:hypothetical protein
MISSEAERWSLGLREDLGQCCIWVSESMRARQSCGLCRLQRTAKVMWQKSRKHARIPMGRSWEAAISVNQGKELKLVLRRLGFWGMHWSCGWEHLWGCSALTEFRIFWICWGEFSEIESLVVPRCFSWQHKASWEFWDDKGWDGN